MKLYGAILGDIAGQPYEYHSENNIENFNIHNEKAHITDDTIMTLASADAVLNNIPFAEAYKKWYHLYPNDKYGYGSNFKAWCENHPEAYTTSYGNGCLMRLSPIIYANGNIFDSVICTHNHYDSLRSSFLLDVHYKYNEFPFLEEEPEENKFHINAFSTMCIVNKVFRRGYMHTVHRIEEIIKLGGDTDTNASIIGELSNNDNHYDLRGIDIDFVRSKLDNYQLEVLDKFNKKYD